MFKIDPKRVVAEYVGNNRSDGAPRLSKLAQKIIDAPVEPAVSSMVILGTVQALETAMLAILGFGIYFAYVGNEEFSHYAAIISVTLIISLFTFNISKSHEISAYRTSSRRQAAQSALGRPHWVLCWSACSLLNWVNISHVFGLSAGSASVP